MPRCRAACQLSCQILFRFIPSTLAGNYSNNVDTVPGMGEGRALTGACALGPGLHQVRLTAAHTCSQVHMWAGQPCSCVATAMPSKHEGMRPTSCRQPLPVSCAPRDQGKGGGRKCCGGLEYHMDLWRLRWEGVWLTHCVTCALHAVCGQRGWDLPATHAAEPMLTPTSAGHVPSMPRVQSGARTCLQLHMPELAIPASDWPMLTHTSARLLADLLL